MIYMNNMAVCNYIVGVLGAVIGGLIMQAGCQPSPFGVSTGRTAPVPGVLAFYAGGGCWALFRFCCCFIPLSIKLIYMA